MFGSPSLRSRFTKGAGIFVLGAALAAPLALPSGASAQPRYRQATVVPVAQRAPAQRRAARRFNRRLRRGAVVPPAPVREARPARPYRGAVWVPGYWARNQRNTRWVWRSGRYIAPRPGFVYRAPRWTVNNGRFVFQAGRWLRVRVALR